MTSQLVLPLNDLVIPRGLPEWLAVFVTQAMAETQTLVENGANQAAAARIALLTKLLSAAEEHLDGELTVEEAATIMGKHPETIRRAVRKGTLPDRRTKPRTRVRIRRRDLDTLAGRSTGSYDPVADAQDIAQRRRK
jgi:excisionase family DNA binding protein